MKIRYQWKHYLYFTKNRRPQNRMQLCFEHHEILQTESNRAKTQKRVRLRCETFTLRIFVSTQIHRSYYHRTMLEHADSLGVSFVMFLFGRFIGTVQIQKFCAVQTDPFSTFLQYHLRFTGKFDIAKKFDVGCFRLYVAKKDRFIRKFVIGNDIDNPSRTATSTQVRLNPELPEDIFVYTPPPGVKIEKVK